MKFGYMFDSHEYAPHVLEANGIFGAITKLQQKVPVKYYQNAGNPNNDFYVELWQDKGVERKDMSFDDLKEVYKLYPHKSGRLICNELIEALWKDLQQPGNTIHGGAVGEILVNDWNGFSLASLKSEVEKWLGQHHSRGLDYLRYGDLGMSLGEGRLAQLACNLLQNEETISKATGLAPEVLYNLIGLSHEECVTAGLVYSGMPFYTVHASSQPYQKNNLSGEAKVTSEWFDSIDDALAASNRLLGEGYRYQDICFGEDKAIGHLIAGRMESAKNISHDLQEQAADAIAAFEAAKARLPYPYDRLFFFVGDSMAPPTNIHTEFKENCVSEGVYSLETALEAWSQREKNSEKVLYATVARNYAGQYKLIHIPILTERENKLGILPRFEAESTIRATSGPLKDQTRGILEKCMDTLFPGNMMEVGKWGVKIVPPFGHYGRGNSVLNDSGKELVEFYDRSQDPVKFPGGQFVDRYYMETLLGKDGYRSSEYPLGLSLYADIPAWHVTAQEMEAVTAWLRVKDAKLERERKPSLAEQVMGAEARLQGSAANPNKQKEREDTYERN